MQTVHHNFNVITNFASYVVIRDVCLSVYLMRTECIANCESILAEIRQPWPEIELFNFRGNI